MSGYDVVILDRIIEARPEYCVHGETWCISCNRAVWLGSATYDAVVAGAVPMCLECASAHLPPGIPAKAHLHDHPARPA